MEDITQICPVCMELGKANKMRLFQINLEEAVLLCENQECKHPLLKSSDKVEIIQRGFMDIPSNDEEYEHHKKTLIEHLNGLKKQKMELTKEVVSHDDNTTALNKNNENENILFSELDIMNIDLTDPDLIGKNCNIQEWDKFINDVCSSQELENKTNDVNNSTQITNLDNCEFDFSNLQLEATTADGISSVNYQEIYPIMNIPVEILPQVPEANASEFSPGNFVSMVPPQSNRCKISIEQDSQRILTIDQDSEGTTIITLPGMQDGSPFETPIYSRDSPSLRGRGYGYTRRRSRGGKKMLGMPRETTTETDTNELPEEENPPENYLFDPDYGKVRVPRGQGQRRRRARGVRGNRGRGLGNLVPGSPGERAEDGTLVPFVKKRRGRPSYKNFHYDRSHYNPPLTITEDTQEEKAKQDQFLHQPLLVADILEKDPELHCPADFNSDLATVSNLEGEVVEKAMDQILLADPDLSLAGNTEIFETTGTVPKNNEDSAVNAALIIQNESFAPVSESAIPSSKETAGKQDDEIEKLDTETVDKELTSKPAKKSRRKAPVAPMGVSTRSTRSTRQKGLPKTEDKVSESECSQIDDVDRNNKKNQTKNVTENYEEKVTKKKTARKKKDIPDKKNETRENLDKIEANVVNTLDTSQNNVDRGNTSGAFSTFSCFVDLSKFK